MLACVDRLAVDDAATYTVGRCTITTVYLHSDIPTQCAQLCTGPWPSMFVLHDHIQASAYQRRKVPAAEVLGPGDHSLSCRCDDRCGPEHGSARLCRRQTSPPPARRKRAPRQQLSVVDAATGDGAQVDAAELALLQRMGLPSAFSTTKARLVRRLVCRATTAACFS